MVGNLDENRNRKPVYEIKINLYVQNKQAWNNKTN